METCLLSYRDDIERLAQVTPRRSQIFLTSRGLKNTQLRRPVPFFPFILDQDAFMQIYFDIKLKTDKLCVSDTCFLYVYWYIGQPPTPMGHTHPTHTHLLYSVPGLFFFFCVTFFDDFKGNTHVYKSAKYNSNQFDEMFFVYLSSFYTPEI